MEGFLIEAKFKPLSKSLKQMQNLWRECKQSLEMLLIEPVNNNLVSILKQKPFPKHDVQLYDFDGYSIKVSPNKSITFTPASPDILIQYGEKLQEYIKNEVHLKTSINHKNTELTISLANQDITDELCNKLGRIKQDITIFPLYLACMEFPNNTGLQISYSIRPIEKVFVQCLTDKILITMSIAFEEASDEVLAKVIHQEFETVKRQHAFQSAPSISISKTAPFQDSAETANAEEEVENPKMYITFGLFQRTITDERVKTIDVIVTFRNFLHYHIKCTKAFIHSRMNTKTNQFLQALNFPEQF